MDEGGRALRTCSASGLRVRNLPANRTDQTNPCSLPIRVIRRKNSGPCPSVFPCPSSGRDRPRRRLLLSPFRLFRTTTLQLLVFSRRKRRGFLPSRLPNLLVFDLEGRKA